MTNESGTGDLSSFGTMLRQRRRAAGLTQEELAELAGITPRALGGIETDVVRRPQRHTVERLASALHLTGADRERFVAMGRRLSSCIDIRYVAAQSPQRASAYLIADDRAIVYRLRADTWDGVADINNPQAARAYLQEFDQVWNASAAEHGLRAARRG